MTSRLPAAGSGGLKRFEKESLQPAFDELGRIAIALADNLNHQHQIGMDLEGDLGGTFFTEINAPAAQAGRVIANANNQTPVEAALGVQITDSGALKAGTWSLKFSGDGHDFELLDQVSGKVVQTGRLPSPLPAEISMPGFNIQISGAVLNAGDSYLIQPTRHAASSLELKVDREEELAFASPVRAETDAGNRGTGKIDQGVMLNVRNPLTNSLLPGFSSQGKLDPPLEIVFSEDGGTGRLQYTVVDANNPAVTVFAAQDFQEGVSNTLFSDDPRDPQYVGFQFRISGKPAPGDRFTIGYNTGGVSDNRNAELMAGLATANTMNGGTQSFTEGYAGLVETVGVKTRQSQLDKDAGQALLEQSFNQRESVSGVNLDEEAGRLIQYQAAYNASAKVMNVAQNLFDTLLSTFR
ncbi:FlgK family flagellar hook-associated protein [Marinobacter sp. X15-166B]|uniref:FlgK family flagellar hook-associated protein n=1 Tax=Marinobacter sp. X15-166B TaxID=1897620 RepID=UPI000B010650|nr:flagellar basal body rod C-terminal domain-containing protein [Marinobacter sp. X15-166B]